LDFITFIAVAALSFVIGSLTLIPWIYGVDPAWLPQPWNLSTRIGPNLHAAEWPSLPRWLATIGKRPAAKSRQTYVVQPGDTLSEIARAKAVPLPKLIEQNGLVDPDVLSVGQALVIGEDHAGATGPSAQSAASNVAAAGELERGSLENDRSDGFTGIFRSGAVALHRLVRGARIEPSRTPTGGVATVDALLATAEEQLRSARFEDALEAVRVAVRLLDSEGDSNEANSRRAALELVRAEAHLAFGDALPAGQSFERALDADPDLVLDPDATSPKVLRAFARARTRRRSAP
jgi:LysM repeat protein